jgi:hypothetical protein
MFRKMPFFQGNVINAISQARNERKLLVVVVQDENDKLNETWKDSNVKGKNKP